MEGFARDFYWCNRHATNAIFALGNGVALLIFAIPRGDESVKSNGKSFLRGIFVKDSNEFVVFVENTNGERAFNGRRKKGDLSRVVA